MTRQHRTRSGSLIEAIAIDGPVASGKSAVGNRVASRLGYAFLDTGIMYRAVALRVANRGIDPKDPAAVLRELDSTRIEVEPSRPALDQPGRVLLDGEDVTVQLRGPDVDRVVSAIAKIKEVRTKLISMQREVAKAGPIVMVGRDIADVVLPNARLKVFLRATPDTRAKRRWLERRERGEDSDYDEVLTDLTRRDALDDRTTPLLPVAGAIVIETEALNIDEVTDLIVAQVPCRS